MASSFRDRRDGDGMDSAPKLFVGGFPFDMNQDEHDEIVGMFEKYGTITEITIPRDPASKVRNKGFGFITYDNFESMHLAISKMNGKSFHGQVLKVDRAKENKHEARGGGQQDQQGGGYQQPGGYSNQGGGGGRDRDSGGYRSNYNEGPRRGAPGPGYDDRDGGGSAAQRPREQKSVGFRCRVTGLGAGVDWRILKDFLRQAGDVTYAQVDPDGLGIGEFPTLSEVRDAIDKLSGAAINGHIVTLKPLNFDMQTGQRLYDLNTAGRTGGRPAYNDSFSNRDSNRYDSRDNSRYNTRPDRYDSSSRDDRRDYGRGGGGNGGKDWQQQQRGGSGYGGGSGRGGADWDEPDAKRSRSYGTAAAGTGRDYAGGGGRGGYGGGGSTYGGGGYQDRGGKTGAPSRGYDASAPRGGDSGGGGWGRREPTATAGGGGDRYQPGGYGGGHSLHGGYEDEGRGGGYGGRSGAGGYGGGGGGGGGGYAPNDDRNDGYKGGDYGRGRDRDRVRGGGVADPAGGGGSCYPRERERSLDRPAADYRAAGHDAVADRGHYDSKGRDRGYDAAASRDVAGGGAGYHDGSSSRPGGDRVLGGRDGRDSSSHQPPAAEAAAGSPTLQRPYADVAGVPTATATASGGSSRYGGGRAGSWTAPAAAPGSGSKYGGSSRYGGSGGSSAAAATAAGGGGSMYGSGGGGSGGGLAAGMDVGPVGANGSGPGLGSGGPIRGHHDSSSRPGPYSRP